MTTITRKHHLVTHGAVITERVTQGTWNEALKTAEAHCDILHSKELATAQLLQHTRSKINGELPWRPRFVDVVSFKALQVPEATSL
jgi:hypothetical protein